MAVCRVPGFGVNLATFPKGLARLAGLFFHSHLNCLDFGHALFAGAFADAIQTRWVVLMPPHLAVRYSATSRRWQ
jgi:hypothetical protein